MGTEKQYGDTSTLAVYLQIVSLDSARTTTAALERIGQTGKPIRAHFTGHLHAFWPHATEGYDRDLSEERIVLEWLLGKMPEDITETAPVAFPVEMIVAHFMTRWTHLREGSYWVQADSLLNVMRARVLFESKTSTEPPFRLLYWLRNLYFHARPSFFAYSASARTAYIAETQLETRPIVEIRPEARERYHGHEAAVAFVLRCANEAARLHSIVMTRIDVRPAWSHEYDDDGTIVEIQVRDSAEARSIYWDSVCEEMDRQAEYLTLSDALFIEDKLSVIVTPD